MRIGLASDSHGNVEPLERALEAFARAGVDRVFFLGGRLADLDAALARRGRAPPPRPPPPPRTDAARPGAEGALAPPGAAGKDPLDGRIVRVASRACAEYARPEARKQVDLVEGRICCLVHDKAELTRDDIANATLLFHGNGAGPALVQIGARFFVTPGPLRGGGPGCAPTFAILEATARDLVLTAYAPSGAAVAERRATFGGPGGKLSVRG